MKRSPFARASSAEKNGIIKLSTRQIDILRLIAKGKTSSEIGEALNISVNTVTTHRKNILSRSGFNKIAHLIGHLAGKGLI